MLLRTLGRVGGVAFLAVVVSRLILLLAFHPTFSDVANYENSAARVVAIVAAKLSPPGAEEPGGKDDGGLSGAASPIFPAYPALAIAFMTAAGFNVAVFDPVYPDSYADQYRLVLFVIDLLIAVTLVLAAGSSLVGQARSGVDRLRPLAMYGLAGILFGYLLYDRLDLVVGALLLGSILLILGGSWRGSFLFLAAAIGFKAIPVVLAPLWIVGSLPAAYWSSGFWQERGRAARVLLTRSLFLAGAIALFFVPFIVAVGSLALNFIRFNAIRGVQLESIPSSILLLLRPLGVPIRVVDAFGAFDVDSPAAPAIAALSPLLVAVAVLAATVMYAFGLRRAALRLSIPEESPPGQIRLAAAADPQRFVAATLLILLLTIDLSKVLSPQYLLWILPIVPLLAFDSKHGRLFVGGFLVVAFLSVLVFPILYEQEFLRIGPAGGFLEPGFLGVAVLVLRNAMLVGMAVLLIRVVMTQLGIPAQRGQPIPTA